MTVFNDGMDAAAEYGGRKYFTVSEADRSLVLVRRIVRDVVFEYKRLLDSQEAIEAAGSDAKMAQSAQDQAVSSAETLQTCLDELTLVGVELRDWSLGVVDFPCIADGREVRLCWRCDEDSVSYCHDVDAGCGAREPINGVAAVVVNEVSS